MARTFASTVNAANSVILVDGDLDAIGQFFSPDYVAHGTGKNLTGGHDAVRKFISALRRAFPKLEVEVEILVEGKDRIAWQRTLRGRQERDYKGFPAAGRLIVWRDMVTSRFHDDRIAEDWVITDLAEQLLRTRKR